ncbi:hypothetical protein KHA80_21580 [Anaerobacillus sp. HL2]|nr:hypothetical protein KHA80_21580 [Anaerobacillus sp. HL2]
MKFNLILKSLFSHIKAEDIRSFSTELMNIPAVIVESQFIHQNLVGRAPNIELHEFTEMMLTPSKTGFAAIIQNGEGEEEPVFK